MSRVLLDSNLTIYSVDPSDTVTRAFIAEHEVYVSEVSVVEVLGYHALVAGEKQALERFFAACALLPVTRDVINAAVVLRQRRKMSLGDSLIAATALVHDLILGTRHQADFADIEGLVVVNPYV